MTQEKLRLIEEHKLRGERQERSRTKQVQALLSRGYLCQNTL